MIAFINEAGGQVRTSAQGVVRRRDRPLTVPADLRLWADVPTITGWIEREVGDVCGSWDPAQMLAGATGILRVLTFAYATQWYSTEEIVRECRRDIFFQRLCRESAPFVYELRSFRRKHRAVLETVLSGVFMRAMVHRFGLSAVSVPDELRSDLRNHARERLNIARHLDAGEE